MTGPRRLILIATSTWPVILGAACGGSTGGAGNAVTPGPIPSNQIEAKLAVTGDGEWPSCSVGLLGVTPMKFDASGSLGTNLSYLIDFGDGSPVVPTRQATHRYTREASLTAKPTLTVAGSNGRVSVDQKNICLIMLSGIGISWDNTTGDLTGGTSRYILPSADVDDAGVLSGWYHSAKRRFPLPDETIERLRFTGRLLPDYRVALTLENGSTLSGTMTVVMSERCCFEDVYFDLTAHGGADDGLTFRYTLHDSY